MWDLISEVLWHEGGQKVVLVPLGLYAMAINHDGESEIAGVTNKRHIHLITSTEGSEADQQAEGASTVTSNDNNNNETDKQEKLETSNEQALNASNSKGGNGEIDEDSAFTSLDDSALRRIMILHRESTGHSFASARSQDDQQIEDELQATVSTLLNDSAFQLRLRELMEGRDDSQVEDMEKTESTAMSDSVLRARMEELLGRPPNERQSLLATTVGSVKIEEVVEAVSYGSPIPVSHGNSTSPPLPPPFTPPSSIAGASHLGETPAQSSEKTHAPMSKRERDDIDRSHNPTLSKIGKIEAPPGLVTPDRHMATPAGLTPRPRMTSNVKTVDVRKQLVFDMGQGDEAVTERTGLRRVPLSRDVLDMSIREEAFAEAVSQAVRGAGVTRIEHGKDSPAVAAQSAHAGGLAVQLSPVETMAYPSPPAMVSEGSLWAQISSRDEAGTSGSMGNAGAAQATLGVAPPTHVAAAGQAIADATRDPPGAATSATLVRGDPSGHGMAVDGAAPASVAATTPVPPLLVGLCIAWWRHVPNMFRYCLNIQEKSGS